MAAFQSRRLNRSPTIAEERESSPGLLLAVLGHAAMRRLRDAHTTHGLNPRQVQLLARLHDHGTMRQTDLGRAISTAPSVLVTLLNPLEAAGYISRDRDPADRRRHVVALTPAGERHLDRAAAVQREVEDALFAGLDHAERDQLRTLLLAVRRSLTRTGQTQTSATAADATGEEPGPDVPPVAEDQGSQPRSAARRTA